MKRGKFPIEFPTIEGEVVKRPENGEESVGWWAHSFGYAYANYQTTISLAMIVYAETIEDVQKVVEYAEESNIAIAVRSGGHYYQVASSITGNNISLDLSGLL